MHTGGRWVQVEILTAHPALFAGVVCRMRCSLEDFSMIGA